MRSRERPAVAHEAQGMHGAAAVVVRATVAMPRIVAS
jgi:hypothetical protein